MHNPHPAKPRLIIPLVVGILCAGSAIGAAVGWSSSDGRLDKIMDYRLKQKESRQRDPHLDERIGAPLIPGKNHTLARARSKGPGLTEGMPPMQGLIIRTNSWTASYEGSHPGFYSIPLDEVPQEFGLIKEISDLPWSFFGCFGAVYTPDAFYFNLADYQNGQINGTHHYLFDPETWEIKKSWHSDDFDIWVNSGAYDPTSGLVYANITMAQEHYNAFATFDINTGKASEIAVIPYDNALMYGTYRLAFSSTGELYGLSCPRQDDPNASWDMYLVKVDKSNGQPTPIGKLDIDYRTVGAEYAFTIDPYDSKAYLAFNSYPESGDNGSIYSISLNDASTQLVYDLPDNEGFKHIWFPFVLSDDVPGEVTDFAADFTDDSLDGTLTFTLPSETKGGDKITGELSYEITLNGNSLTNGTGLPGENVSVNVSAPASDYYTIGIRVRNNVGYNTVKTIDMHIGRDIPSIMKNVRALYNRQTEMLTLTWDTPEPLNGGFFEPDKLSYNITDYFGVTTTGVTGNSYTVHLDEPENGFYDWYFRIQPVYDGQVFQTVSSNRVVIGNMALPFECGFKGSDSQGFSFINANEDWRSWEISTLWNHMTLQGNTNEASDDWAILPPTDMKAGLAYRVNMDVRPLMPTMPESFTINVGNDTTVAALRDNVILPETTISNSYYGESIVHAYYAPDKDGRYYFAIHGITPAQNGTLYVGNVSIEEPVSAKLAAEMTDFSVARADDGTLKAILSFTASSVNLAGDPIDRISKIIIKRNDEVVEELQAEPGQKIVWTDNTVPDNGVYTYSVTPVTDEGVGIPCIRKAFIGVRVPSDLKYITARKGVDTGHFIIEWDSDPVDVTGEPFDEDQLSYNLYICDPYSTDVIPIADGIKAKKKVYRLCQADDPQTLVFFGAEPVNTAGAGAGKRTEAIFAGKPDPTPFSESFSNKSPHHIYYVDYHPYYYATWIFANDSDFPDITSVDGDNGFLVFGSEEAGNQASYISGNIDLTGLESPVLSYFYYTWEWSNTVDLEVFDGEEWIQMDSFASSDDYNVNGLERWVRRSIDLSQFSGKIIRYRLVGKCVDALYTLVDNIHIGNNHNTDLDISTFKAKAKVKSGEPFDLTAIVANYGSKPIDEYHVDLYDNGELVETVEMPEILSGASDRITIPRSISMAEEPVHTYKLIVVCEGDEETSNNETPEITVSCIQPIYPEPQSLSGEENGKGVCLEWEAPDLSGERRITVTDDVEDYTDFSIGMPVSDVPDDFIGEWTMKDVDNAYTYTFNGANSHYNRQARMAFMVFNPSAAGVDTDMSDIWKPYSGDKMFASFLPVRNENLPLDDPEAQVEKDDWLISPMLTGEEQTISFHARTMSPSYAKEKFEFYYSSSLPAIENMIKIGDVNEADYTWEEYSFQIPEGAKYFAIRNIGADGFVFLVDDIVYRPASASGIGINLLGYNVYRDCILLTPTPVSEPGYIDLGATAGSHSYQVTAVYDRGESVPAQITLECSQINPVNSKRIGVYSRKGYIYATGVEGLELTLQTSDGKLLRTMTSETSTAVFDVPAGVYILTINGKGYKVAVH